MSKKYYFYVCLAVLIGLSSCNSMRIEKRHYNKGWYLDFGTDKKSESVTLTSKEEEKADAETIPVAEQTATTPVSFSTGENSAQQLPDVVTGGNNTVVAVSEEATVSVESTEPTTPEKKNENVLPKNVPPSEQVSPAGDDQVLLIILAILIPPLAVYLVQGASTVFWITLLFWLFGGFFLFGRFGYGYIGGLGLVAIVLALLVVFGKL